jgi:hypothetical protein
VAGVIEDAQIYQHRVYNLRAVPRLAALLRSLPQSDEKVLYARSLEIEPRGAKPSG